jgi:hypothetical protein
VIDNKNQFIKGTIKKGLTKVQVPINLKNDGNDLQINPLSGRIAKEV